MELVTKTFEKLSALELFEIYKLRAAVFVVEQNSPYQDVDDEDLSAYHMYLRDDEGIQAYLRVIPVSESEAHIGRVIAVKRRSGLGAKILESAITLIKSDLKAKIITIEAQTYVKGFYEKFGFVQVSEEFVLEGRAHIKMELTL